MILIAYTIEILFGLALLFFSAILLYSMLFGAPYAPLGMRKTKRLVKLLNVKKGEKTLDLGAGDGRLVIEMAKKGADATGYEINPILVLIGNWRIKKAGQSKNARILWKDFWMQNFSEFDVITIYLSFISMRRLEKKMQKETKKGTRIGMNYFHFPKWKYALKEEDLYVYKK